jgi:threonine/homoserine/homoserine lactone efflux protein
MEVISLALLGILIVISPGADFVLVLKNSLNQGRAAGVWTAIGIGLAIAVHVSYSMLGIGYFISQNEDLFNLVRYAGAAYLVYLGIRGLLSTSAPLFIGNVSKEVVTTTRFLTQGFLCNVLNPKTMLFFLSIFSQLVSSEEGSELSALIYGIYMMIIHAVWFCLVALFFTSGSVQKYFSHINGFINKLCGIGLIAFGTLLAFN